VSRNIIQIRLPHVKPPNARRQCESPRKLMFPGIDAQVDVLEARRLRPIGKGSHHSKEQREAVPAIELDAVVGQSASLIILLH
jgi:hypothetical protein